jgi:hypothetical protein
MHSRPTGTAGATRPQVGVAIDWHDQSVRTVTHRCVNVTHQGFKKCHRVGHGTERREGRKEPCQVGITQREQGVLFHESADAIPALLQLFFLCRLAFGTQLAFPLPGLGQALGGSSFLLG